MALLDNAWYVDSVGYTAITAWSAATAKTVGNIVRQVSNLGAEKAFICIVAGTSHATTEPTWVLTRGAKTVDNASITWQECTGIAGLNGDATNTPDWAAYKASTSAGSLGQFIKNNAATHYFIMTTAGTIGASQPSFNTTLGATTTDNAATWTCLGTVGSYTGNQAPFARLRLAVLGTWCQPGNTIYVKSSSAETQTTTYVLLGVATQALPVKILCHNGAAYPPAAGNLTTGATVSCSHSSGIPITGTFDIQGIEFIITGGVSSVGVGGYGLQTFKNCKFTQNSGGATGILVLTGGNPSGRTILDNVQVSFSHTNQSIYCGNGHFEWRNTASPLVGASVPTVLFSPESGATGGSVTVNGLDLSLMTSGKTLVATGANSGEKIIIQNCKLDASVTVATLTSSGSTVALVNCDSGTKNYRNEFYQFSGAQTTETTIILTDGASDGTTGISWKIITTANSSWLRPFECPPIGVWNESTGSPMTATIQGIWGGGAVPLNDEIWLEIEYLGSSATPISSFVNDTKATVLTAGAAQDAGTGTWGGSTTKFALACTFTPQMKGLIVARVKCAKVSSTFYIDPKIYLT